MAFRRSPVRSRSGPPFLLALRASENGVHRSAARREGGLHRIPLVVGVSISAYFPHSRRRVEPHPFVPTEDTDPISGRLHLHSQQHGRSGSVLHRHHRERPSAAGRTQPRRLPAYAALDTVASDCRRRVCEREARARLRAISQDRVGLRVRSATLQVKRVMPRA